MTIDKAQLKSLVDSPRCGVSWPQFDSVCGKTKDDRRGTWQCGECARKEASALRAEMDKYLGLFREADEHANHWQGQSLIKSRSIGELTREVSTLKSELAGLRTGYDAQNELIARQKAESEALRKDADRYRELRDNGYLDSWADVHICDEHRRPGLIDSSIDAAMWPDGAPTNG